MTTNQLFSKTLQTGFISFKREHLQKLQGMRNLEYRVALNLAQNASYTDKQYKGFEIPRGSVITSVARLIRHCSASSYNEMRNALNRLEEAGIITQQSLGKLGRHIICNGLVFSENNINQDGKVTDKQACNEQIKIPAKNQVKMRLIRKKTPLKNQEKNHIKTDKVTDKVTDNAIYIGTCENKQNKKTSSSIFNKLNISSSARNNDDDTFGNVDLKNSKYRALSELQALAVDGVDENFFNEHKITDTEILLAVAEVFTSRGANKGDKWAYMAKLDSEIAEKGYVHFLKNKDRLWKFLIRHHNQVRSKACMETFSFDSLIDKSTETHKRSSSNWHKFEEMRRELAFLS